MRCWLGLKAWESRSRHFFVFFFLPDLDPGTFGRRRERGAPLPPEQVHRRRPVRERHLRPGWQEKGEKSNAKGDSGKTRKREKKNSHIFVPIISPPHPLIVIIAGEDLGSSGGGAGYGTSDKEIRDHNLFGLKKKKVGITQFFFRVCSFLSLSSSFWWWFPTTSLISFTLSGEKKGIESFPRERGRRGRGRGRVSSRWRRQVTFKKRL